jgi:hypothetical protein
MSLRQHIRDCMPIQLCVCIEYYGKKVSAFHDDTVNAIANRWYRAHYPEPRFMCPRVDPHRPFTLAELADYRKVWGDHV